MISGFLTLTIDYQENQKQFFQSTPDGMPVYTVNTGGLNPSTSIILCEKIREKGMF